MSFPQYPSYKDSGVEWLGKVPSGWDVKPLKRETRLVTERAGSRSRPLGLENIEGWSGKLVETETEFEGDGVAFKEGDVLYGKLRPYLAKVHAAAFSGEAVGDFHVLRPETKTSSRFIAYALLTREIVSVLDGSTFGAKMPRVGWEFLCGLGLAFPPLPEQRAIADFLDRETAKIDALVEAQRRLISLLKEKRQAVISHAVTKGLDPSVPLKPSGIPWLGDIPAHWEVKPLKRLAAVMPSNVDKKTVEGQISVQLCNYTDVYYNDLITREISFMEASASAEQIGRFGLRAGDVILTKDSETADDIAISAYVPANLPGVVCGYHLAVIRSKSSVADGAFLKRYFDSAFAKASVAVRANGLTRVGLGQYALDNLQISTPSVAEQRAIADFLDRETAKIDALVEAQRRLVALLQERRAALISAAVTGKIDVRGLVAEPEAAEAA